MENPVIYLNNSIADRITKNIFKLNIEKILITGGRELLGKTIE